MTLVPRNWKKKTGRSLGRIKVLKHLSPIFVVFLFHWTISAQVPTPTCTPKPQSSGTTVEKPYTISYSFKASDRKWGDSTGISKQSGSFIFGLDLTKNISIYLTNQNFVVGKDSTGSRAINFGNTSFTVDYIPFQESTSWADDRFTPTVTFEYNGTFPTGSRSRGLNVGRVDHDFKIAIDKKIGERLAKTGNKTNFVRRNSIETDFGISFSANDGGGYKKTGSFILVFNHLFGDVDKNKYKYKAEFDWLSLSNKAKASATLLNSMNFKLDDNNTRFVTGLTLGLTRGTPRFALSFKIVFNGKFVWKKSS
jgi:hypothetical protein